MDTHTIEKLKNFVVKHRVCWEVLPLQAKTRQGVHPIGYEIHLLGTHDEPHPSIMPGCAHCVEVYHDLYQIARAVLPPPDRPSTYEISEFDGALRYAAHGTHPPAVQVTITVRHRTEWDAPVDPCEDRCVQEITHSLSQLGAPRGAWPEERRSDYKEIIQ